MNGNSVFKCFRSCHVFHNSYSKYIYTCRQGSDFHTPSLNFLFFVFFSCGDSCPSECEASIHVSSHKWLLQGPHTYNLSSWEVEAGGSSGYQVIPSYTELLELAWAIWDFDSKNENLITTYQTLNEPKSASYLSGQLTPGWGHRIWRTQKEMPLLNFENCWHY